MILLKGKEKKKKSNKIVNILICIVVLSFLIVGVFYGTYSYMITKSADSYEKNMSEHITTLNNINKKVAVFVKDQTIDTEAAKKGLSACIDELVALKSDLQGEVPSEQYKISHANIIDGVQSNAQIYRQILSILQNPSSNDIDKAVNNLTKYREECVKNYAQFSLKDKRVELPKEASAFIENSTSYTLELIKIKKDLDIKNAQNLEFSEKLNTVIAKFVPLKIDFKVQLQKIRTGIGSYDDVLALIDQNKEQYAALKKEYSSITPPQTASKVFYAFNSVLDDYNLFLQEIRFAVTNEKLMPKNKPLDEISLKNLYTTSDERFSTLETNYDNFLKSFTDYKLNNIK